MMTKNKALEILSLNFFVSEKQNEWIHIFQGEKVLIHSERATIKEPEFVSVYVIIAQCDDESKKCNYTSTRFLVEAFPMCFVRNSLKEAMQIITAIKKLSGYSELNTFLRSIDKKTI